MQQVKRKPLKQLLQNEQLFWEQIEECVRNISSQQQLHPQVVKKMQIDNYPWNNIQQAEIIKELREMLLVYADHSIHEVVNNQIIALSEQMLNIRNQLTDFTLTQSKKNKEFHENAIIQIEQLKKKVATNSIINKQKQLQGPRYSRSHANVEPKSVLSQLSIIKSEMQKMKDASSMIDTSIFQGKVQMLESQIAEMKLQNKMRMEQIKQKNNRIINEVNERMKDNSSKQLIASQVKASMKARTKVFNIQISQIKTELEKLKQSNSSNQIEIQNYISNQLKSIWVHNINLKRRIQKVEAEIDIVNASFVVD